MIFIEHVIIISKLTFYERIRFSSPSNRAIKELKINPHTMIDAQFSLSIVSQFFILILPS